MFGLEGKLGIRERQGEAGQCCNKQHATGLVGSLQLQQAAPLDSEQVTNMSFLSVYLQSVFFQLCQRAFKQEVPLLAHEVPELQTSGGWALHRSPSASKCPGHLLLATAECSAWTFPLSHPQLLISQSFPPQRSSSSSLLTPISHNSVYKSSWLTQSSSHVSLSKIRWALFQRGLRAHAGGRHQEQLPVTPSSEAMQGCDNIRKPTLVNQIAAFDSQCFKTYSSHSQSLAGKTFPFS